MSWDMGQKPYFQPPPEKPKVKYVQKRARPIHLTQTYTLDRPDSPLEKVEEKMMKETQVEVEGVLTKEEEEKKTPKEEEDDRKKKCLLLRFLMVYCSEKLTQAAKNENVLDKPLDENEEKMMALLAKHVMELRKKRRALNGKGKGKVGNGKRPAPEFHSKEAQNARRRESYARKRLAKEKAESAWKEMQNVDQPTIDASSSSSSVNSNVTASDVQSVTIVPSVAALTQN